MDQPAANKTERAGDKVTVVQLCLLVLSLVAMVALVIDVLVDLPEEVSRTVQAADFLVCALLFADFSWRLLKAPHKGFFMKTGWIDLIACIPNIDLLRAGRLVRVFRIVRLLRSLRAGYRLFQIFRENRPKSALASALTTTLLLIAFSSTSILIAETSPNSNIKTAEDAIWWSVTTLTTVGYGDRYPVTTEGRLIAMVLMIGGVGLFGVLSGLMASFLLHKKTEEENADLKKILDRLEQLEERLRK